eukprot:TRINITY_DN3269_c0_g1_i1.p1 TRINITY_DN3269_c0_g1~~TRINITY_DN3269_c0_g1_i1.p1  ORF type:complete len:224 (+),score=43.68 TRINITY_DN3269_c0_g1_i1:76-747(+)
MGEQPNQEEEEVVWVHASEITKKYKKVKTVKGKEPVRQEKNRLIVKSDLGTKEYVGLVQTKIEECGEVVVRAKGEAINRLLTVVERARRANEDIHVTMETESTELQEFYDLKEQHVADLPLHLACHTISISLLARFSLDDQNPAHPGYQAPVSSQHHSSRKHRTRRGNTRRSKKLPRSPPLVYDDDDDDDDDESAIDFMQTRFFSKKNTARKTKRNKIMPVEW